MKNLDIRFAKDLEDVVKIAIIDFKLPAEPHIKHRIVNLPTSKKTALVRVVKMNTLSANRRKKQ
jgi:hypothetical protein